MSSETAAIADAPRRVFIPFRPAEREAFRKRKKLSGPDYAEKNIVVPTGARQGLYRHKNNPALYGILEIGSRPHVRKLVLGKGIQTGGTFAVYILVLREADYSSGGDNALLVMADEGSVKKLSRGRLRKMIDKSPRLAALKSSNPDDTAIRSITLANGFVIDAAWISSETSVSSESYRVVVLDEISKPAYRKHRGNISDAKGRTTTFPDTKKVFILSSPDEDTDDPSNRDPLMEEMESCDVTFDLHVKCPDCGAEQVMIFEQIGWPEQKSLLPNEPPTANPAEIRRLKTAWYQCAHCPSRWNDYKRDKAVLAAMKDGWKPSMEVEHFESVYMHYPSWCSPFVSLSEVAARWLEAQGDDELLKKWYNLIAGISWRREKKQQIKDDHILKYRSDLPRGLVPPDTARLGLLVDTQQSSFYYEVWALGYAPRIELHMVDHGILDVFEDIDGLLEKDYFDHANRQFRIGAGLIDSGGTRRGWQKHSRTYEVYEWCAKHKTIMPLKGIPGRAGDMVSYKQIETFPKTNKPIPGGLKRVNVRVDFFKDDLEGRLAKEPDDPKALSFHCDIDVGFAKHFTGEIKDAAGDWIHRNRNIRIDYCDCTNYALVLREVLKLRIPKKPAPAEEKPPAAPPPQSFVANQGGGGFVGGGFSGGWGR